MEASGTIEKAVDVLFHLHGAAQPQGVTAIGRALGLPKSSAHRLLQSLGGRGLVEQDERGRYRPGVALVALGLGVLEQEPIVAAARPILEREAEDLAETFFLVAPRSGQLVVLDKVEGTGFLRAAPRVGTVVPLHATAVGKLYLALDPAAVQPPPDFLSGYTPRTLTSSSALDAAVREVRQRGFASNRDEWIPGLSVLAAPVVAGGRMRGALALAAASPRLEELGGETCAVRVIAAADRIAARLSLTSRATG